MIPVQKNSFDAAWAVIEITLEAVINFRAAVGRLITASKCPDWHVGAVALDKIGKREDNSVTCKTICEPPRVEWLCGKAENVEQGSRIEKR